MQEPYGAFTWYPVNDQPSDKALYDVTFTRPGDWVGVSNGVLTRARQRRRRPRPPAGTSRPRGVVPGHPGHRRLRDDHRHLGSSGVPISYWVPADRPELADGLRSAPAALDWLEARLGPYPFDTLGIVLVDSVSGMETQTMITLGDRRLHDVGGGGRARDGPPVVRRPGHPRRLARRVDERGHGDVPPGRVAEPRPTGRDCLSATSPLEPASARPAGPPAAYDPAAFGESNIYYGPALMWRELRRRIGDGALRRRRPPLALRPRRPARPDATTTCPGSGSGPGCPPPSSPLAALPHLTPHPLTP